MDVRIQRNVSIGDDFNAKLTYHIKHRFQGQLDALHHRGHFRIGFVRHFQRAIEAVDNRQQFVHELLKRELMRFFHILFGAATHIIDFGF